MEDYREVNRSNWNDRVPIHWAATEYGVSEFIADPGWISKAVEFDRQALGNVSQKTLLHLQCHIGTDTLSWARLGATVTGIDLSDASIEAARRLSRESGTPGRFVVSEVYESPKAIPFEQFDIVYTGIGAICWLPDIRRWAQVVAHFLRPGGTFYIRDGHPVLNSLDYERTDGQLVIKGPYFETTEPLVSDDEATYFGEGTLEHTRNHEWNHGLGEIVSSLIEAGLEIESLHEHQHADWHALPSLVEADPGRWTLKDDPERLPMMFSLRARKKTG